MKKILILLFSSVALVSCCDTSSTIGLMVCQEKELQSKILWQDFADGAAILLVATILLPAVFYAMYKIKNKNISSDKFLLDYSFVIVGSWIIIMFMWAIAVYLFNGGALLKYVGLA